MATESYDLALSSDELDEIERQLAAAFGPSHAASEPGGTDLEPDDTWTFQNGKGTAWVFLAEGHTQLTNPVIASDGFKGEPSKLEDWSVLWTDDPEDPRGYPWGKDLSAAGKDLIILGYTGTAPVTRTASILENATIAKDCIIQAIDERASDGDPLVVGGFSMGGLITRYALALMEWELKNGIEGAVPHQTSTYFSYDSPHRGGWVPISVQAFGHYLKGLMPSIPTLATMLNSPAARQMAVYHIEKDTGNPTPALDPMRGTFLRELERVGSFPREVEKRIAVANRPADRQVRPLPSDNKTFELEAPGRQATLYGQDPASGHLVADMKKRGSESQPWTEIQVRTSGIPALDGAPGGTLDTNQILVNILEKVFVNATKLEAAFPWGCFVPTVSALDVAAPETDATAPIPSSPPEGCGFDAYQFASSSPDPERLAHTLLTKELCTWLTENLE